MIPAWETCHGGGSTGPVDFSTGKKTAEYKQVDHCSLPVAPTGPKPTRSKKDKCTEVSLLGVEQDGAYTWREQRISSPLKLDLGFPCGHVWM